MSEAWVKLEKREIDHINITKLINETPTADVVEVLHGEWIPTGGETLFLREFRCNRCKSRQLGNTKYCPNCGAKMDRKKVE